MTTPALCVEYAKGSRYEFFSHPDLYTVGPGITPDQPSKQLADFYRRLGISPCPEEFLYLLIVLRQNNLVKANVHGIYVIIYFGIVCARIRGILWK